MVLTINYDADHGSSHEARIMGFDGVFVTGKVSFDASYPTGGETLDLSSWFPKGNVLGVIFETKNGYLFEYDYTNKKVKALYFNYEAAADGAAIEVPNATDLSSLTDVRFLAWGR